jgi:hypothetical protein
LAKKWTSIILQIDQPESQELIILWTSLHSPPGIEIGMGSPVTSGKIVMNLLVRAEKSWETGLIGSS